jgi:hypothetical protein
MRWFILANGEAKRWNNYMNVDKQLLIIDGEPILHRTVRLLKENGQDDIWIIGKHKVEGANNYIPTYKTPIPKFDVFRNLCIVAPDENKIINRWVAGFVILYGDCYYTEEIIKDVITKEVNKWGHWCCQRPNKFTGKPWEEGYAHKITDVNWWFDKCDEYHKKVASGEINHVSDWCFNRFVIGIDLYTHQPELMKEYDIDWEDETDDFDFPVDYDNWMRNVKGIKK